MERHHADVRKRADRMHELLRMLRKAEDAKKEATAADAARPRKAKSG